MSNIKHLNAKESYLTENGGLIHIFEDGSHTYIEPCILNKIILAYLHLIFDIPYKDEEE